MFSSLRWPKGALLAASLAVAGCGDTASDDPPSAARQIETANDEQSPEVRARRLLELVPKLRKGDIPSQGDEALRDAVKAAKQVTDPVVKSELLLSAARLMTAAELADDTDEPMLSIRMAVNAVDDWSIRIERLAALAMLLKDSRIDAAREFLRQAEQGVEFLPPESQGPSLVVVGNAAANLGEQAAAAKHLARAKDIAARLTPQTRAPAQVRTAAELSKSGNSAEALALLEAAVASARTIADARQRAEALVFIAETAYPFEKQTVIAPLVGEAGTAVESVPDAGVKNALNQRLRVLMTPPEQTPASP